jgi:hypothetical protein
MPPAPKVKVVGHGRESEEPTVVIDRPQSRVGTDLPTILWRDGEFGGYTDALPAQ